MLLKEVILQAANAVRDHRFRASLTMLGIAWGIVTVVLLLAYGQGFHRALSHGFRNAFSDGVGVLRGGQTSTQAGGERAGRRISLKVDDVALVAEQGFVKYASPDFGSLTVSWGTRQTSAGSGRRPRRIMRAETPETGRFSPTRWSVGAGLPSWGRGGAPPSATIPPVGETVAASASRWSASSRTRRSCRATTTRTRCRCSSRTRRWAVAARVPEQHRVPGADRARLEGRGAGGRRSRPATTSTRATTGPSQSSAAGRSCRLPTGCRTACGWC